MTQNEQKALNHGWRWFEYHANQRLTMIRFYLIAIGVIGTAYFTSLIKGYPFGSLLIAIFGAFASFSFYRLDQRVSNLIKLGEAVLDKEEKNLEELLHYNEIRIIKNAEKKEHKYLGSYSKIFRAIFVCMIALFIIASLYSLQKAGMFKTLSSGLFE